MPSLPADTAWVEHGWTTPYYIINSLAIMTYMPMRSYVEPEYLQKMELPDSSLKEVPLSTEVQFIVVLIATLSLKAYRAPTVHSFWMDAFWYCKLMLVFCFYMMNFRVAMGYIVLFAVVHVIVEPPYCNGPMNVPVISSLDEFKTLCAPQADAYEGKTKRGSSAVPAAQDFTVVFFYASFNQFSLNLSPLASALQSQFSSDRLRFYKVDTGMGDAEALVDHVTKGQGFGSKRVPSWIVFNSKGENGQTYPPVSEHGRVTRVKWQLDEIIGHLDLERVTD